MPSPLCATDDWAAALQPFVKEELYAKDPTQRFYSMVGGSLQLEADGDDAYQIDLVGAPLEDLDDEPAGVLELSARFERCEVVFPSSDM